MPERPDYSGLGGHPAERPAKSPFSARFEPALSLGAQGGVLEGLTFGAQDLFEIEGRVAGFGHPDWQATHEPAQRSAAAVERCLEQGAILVGMTISDELAFSINGTHAFFDTSPNPGAPGHGPGGSSGGSASAVGLGLVDFALGPDVRAPSSYCGVLGFRSSTELIDPRGMLPLASSFDAVGWFAKDASTLALVGEAMLPAPPAAHSAHPAQTDRRLTRLVVARDALSVAQPAVQREMLRLTDRLAGSFDVVEEVQLAPEGLASWAAEFAKIQAAESWRCNGEWIGRHGERLSADVRARFERGIGVSAADERAAHEQRARIAQRVAEVLGDDGVLLIPTAPLAAPQLGVPNDELEPYRPKMLELTSISGMAGIPQLCLPWLSVDGKPVGASLLSARGGDRALLRLGEELSA